MTDDDFIAKAREYRKPFEGLERDAPALSEFSGTRVCKAVMIYFTRSGADEPKHVPSPEFMRRHGCRA
jgi:hypothetical protein